MAPAVTAPGWLQELSLGTAGPPWLAMGTSRVDEASWLLPDDDREGEVAERHRLLRDCHDEVFAALPGTEAAGREALDLVLGWEAAHRPDLAVEPVADVAHPLEAAGRRTQEDLVLMVPRHGGHHLDAAVLCFPSHWRLADKLGRSSSAIHEPVPGYAVDLDAKVGRFLDRLRPGVVVARRNHSVHESPVLFAPQRPPARSLAGDEVGEGLWLRSERQTLRLLPASGAVLFTIRVQQAPFAALAGAPEVAGRLADRLDAQPAALSDMNGVAPHLPVVVPWLRRIAANA